MDELVEVYTPYITLRNGQRIFAKNYGLEAFHFFANPRIKEEDENKDQQEPDNQETN